MELSQREFQILSRIAYKLSGINLHEGKKNLLEARLAKRLRATGISSTREYLNFIRHNETELRNFIDAISTNHTYFFREAHHFEWVKAEHRDIWCAACSSGEEPYSIAIYCREKGFSPRILATDISTKVLRTAIKGVYPNEKVMSVPIDQLKRYFKRGTGQWDGYVMVRKEIREMVTFKRFNLLTGRMPFEAFDVIFCRNVLIYFDLGTKQKVISRLCNALRPDGLLVIGGAESLNGLNHPLKYKMPSVYQKAKAQLRRAECGRASISSIGNGSTILPTNCPLLAIRRTLSTLSH